MDTGNLFDHIPPAMPVEFLQTLAAGNGVKIERIVSRGHCSPPSFWYDQPQQEWVLLVAGEAALRFEHDNRLVQMTAGCHVHIGAHERHRVEWTRADTDTIWLAVFY